MHLKKKEIEPAIIWKVSTCQTKRLKLNKNKAKRKKGIKQQRLKKAGTVQNHN